MLVFRIHSQGCQGPDTCFRPIINTSCILWHSIVVEKREFHAAGHFHHHLNLIRLKLLVYNSEWALLCAAVDIVRRVSFGEVLCIYLHLHTFCLLYLLFYRKLLGFYIWYSIIMFVAISVLCTVGASQCCGIMAELWGWAWSLSLITGGIRMLL